MALKMQRFRKEFLMEKVRRMIADRPLVGVAYVGNLNSEQRDITMAELSRTGASISFVKNKVASFALKAEGLDPLIPLLRGQTAIIAGHAEVDTASVMQSMSKKVPDFTVLGACLYRERLLDVRAPRYAN